MVVVMVTSLERGRVVILFLGYPQCFQLTWNKTRNRQVVTKHILNSRMSVVNL